MGFYLVSAIQLWSICGCWLSLYTDPKSYYLFSYIFIYFTFSTFLLYLLFFILSSMPSSIFLCLFLQIRKQLNKISLISVMRGIFKLNNSWSWHTSFIQNLENHDLFHFYFCDTVPLKACVKVERNGLTTHSMRLTV